MRYTIYTIVGDDGGTLLIQWLGDNGTLLIPWLGDDTLLQQWLGDDGTLLIQWLGGDGTLLMPWLGDDGTVLMQWLGDDGTLLINGWCPSSNAMLGYVVTARALTMLVGLLITPKLSLFRSLYCIQDTCTQINTWYTFVL